MDQPRSKDIVVFGGGTATNSLVDVFEDLRQSRNCSLSYVIPISDNGGSSSELIRVFGGPGIGDVRSRLVRLIPKSGSNSNTDRERASIRELFNYRLSSEPKQARSEWLSIVEGQHQLWATIGSEKRELIRSIFNLVNMEIVKRARPPYSTFHFGRASIGNLFLTGARVFTGSLESAIFLLSTICDVPGHVATLPAINSNFTHHISAGLDNGAVITGQNNISHPSEPTSIPDGGGDGAGIRPGAAEQEEEEQGEDQIEDANPPGSLPSLRKTYLDFNKTTTGVSSSSPLDKAQGYLANPELVISPTGAKDSGGASDNHKDDHDLPARISRIWYINTYGQEIRPAANPKVVRAVERADAVVYSIGSLYTSLVPSLVLRGVGRAISGKSASPSSTLASAFPSPQPSRNASPSPSPGDAGNGTQAAANGGVGPRYKILILNSTLDRETGPAAQPLSAVDFILAIARAGLQSQGTSEAAVAALLPGLPRGDIGSGEKTETLQRETVRQFVTHLIYLEDTSTISSTQSMGPSPPRVDRTALSRLGVEAIRIYGRRQCQGTAGAGELRYDEKGLARALEAVVGGIPMMTRGRRNTSQQ